MYTQMHSLRLTGYYMGKRIVSRRVKSGIELLTFKFDSTFKPLTIVNHNDSAVLVGSTVHPKDFDKETSTINESTYEIVEIHNGCLYDLSEYSYIGSHVNSNSFTYSCYTHYFFRKVESEI